jgi:hypothetical protein
MISKRNLLRNESDIILMYFRLLFSFFERKRFLENEIQNVTSIRGGRRGEEEGYVQVLLNDKYGVERAV